MSPTHTMSAHLCKQMFSAWRHDHKGSTSPEPHGASNINPLPSPANSSVYSNGTSYLQRSPSMDSDRSSSSSSGNWRWNSRDNSR